MLCETFIIITHRIFMIWICSDTHTILQQHYIAKITLCYVSVRDSVWLRVLVTVRVRVWVKGYGLGLVAI